METKFTPGPYKVVNATDVFTRLGATNAAGVKADDNDGWQIADCNVNAAFAEGELTTLSLSEARANARLIAAAPELYEALEQAVTSMQDSGYSNEHIAVRAARQALAKARGES